MTAAAPLLLRGESPTPVDVMAVARQDENSGFMITQYRVASLAAIEALLGAQAYDLRGLAPALALRPFYEAIRARVPTMVEDREMGEDILDVRTALANLQFI